MKLQLGYNHPIELREHYHTSRGGGAFSVLYLSDFHFNRFSSPSARRIIDRVLPLQPDLILLGGDYADTAAGLGPLRMLCEALVRIAPVLAIPGNHEWLVGEARVSHLLQDCGARWIDGGSAMLTVRGIAIEVDACPGAGGRDAADIRILCLHRPADLSAFGEQYDIAFAGHLHGGQVVLHEGRGGLYPGRWLYRWNRKEVRFGNCCCYISKGLGDTVPIRYNCPRDMIFVHVEPAIAH